MSEFLDEPPCPERGARDSQIVAGTVGEGGDVGLTKEHLVGGSSTTADADHDSLWGFVHSTGRQRDVDGDDETGSMVMVSRGRIAPFRSTPG